MAEALKQAIHHRFHPRLDALGFASVDRFQDAPEKHHPANLCKEARAVVVMGMAVPRGMLRSPDYPLHAMHRAYHTVYKQLDELALELSNFIESQGDYLAVPVPSYAPMVFHSFEPWGLLSLKHAAVRAGLGAFGRSGLMYHPQYGSLLRLAAVVTSAPLPADPMNDTLPCPPRCNACQKACPPQAFKEGGRFEKMQCLQHTIKHAIYPLALKDAEGLKHIERVINTAGHDYWLACNECLRACPLNRPKREQERD
jgi:epoxyqueuosine reductase QueG